MQYHKINSLFKREKFKNNRLIEGDWATEEFDYLQNNIWEFTEKVDGTNIRIVRKQHHNLEFFGKTDRAQIPKPLLDVLYNKNFNTFDSVFDTDCDVTLYGEGYGPKIQNGGKYRPDVNFVLFDVNINNMWLRRDDVEDIAAKLNLEVVPVIGRGTLHEAIGWAKIGIPSTWGNFVAEGIVARPTTELVDRRGNRIIAKIKCRDF